MGTPRSRTMIQCVSNPPCSRSSSSSSSNSTSRNCNNHDHYVGNDKKSGHHRQTYLRTSTPFLQRLCPRTSGILQYSTPPLGRREQSHHRPMLTEERPEERGFHALLARGNAGGRNRCLYRLRLAFHAKFLIRLGVMMGVRRIPTRALTRILEIDRAS
jgi:hypothetical protein